MRRAAELRREAVGVELAARREHEVDERRRERPEHEQEAALEPAADPRGLEASAVMMTG